MCWQAANAAELTSLQRDIKQLEQLMMAEEIKRANESSRARDLAAPELDALQNKLEQERSRTTTMRNQMMELEAGIRHSNRALEEAHAQLERERCGHLRHVRATVCLRYPRNARVICFDAEHMCIFDTTGIAEREAAIVDQEAK